MTRSFFFTIFLCCISFLPHTQTFATNCGINRCENFPNVTEIEGIEFPLTLSQKQKGESASRGSYFIYHWAPIAQNKAPYIVMLPSSGGITSGSSKTYYRYATKLQRLGFGIVIVDIFYNTDIVKGTGSRGPLASMAALSSIEFIKRNFNEFSNGKFGVLGESRGGMTVLSLASDTIRDNHLYKNVKHWFDAGVAWYPSCGQQNLTMPVQIFIGELDEWVSAVGCKSWRDTDISQVSSGMLDIHIYENAHHLFNRETQKKLYRTKEKDHELTGRAILYNKEADRDSEAKMLRFFTDALR